jgi:hypothetical protein
MGDVHGNPHGRRFVFTGDCRPATRHEEDIDDLPDSVDELRRRCNELLVALKGRGLAVRRLHNHGCVQDG